MKKMLIAAAILIPVYGFSLFKTDSEYNTLYNQKVALELEIKALKRQFDNQSASLNGKISSLQNEIESLQKKIDSLNDEMQKKDKSADEKYQALLKQNEILKQSGSDKEKQLTEENKKNTDQYEAKLAKLLAELHDEKEKNLLAVREIKDAYEKKISALNEQVSALNRDMAEIKALNKQQKDELSRLENQALELEKQLQNEIEKGEIRLKRYHDKLIINIDDKISFASGSADLKPEILPALDKIKKILSDYPEYQIVVEGHTDNIPIKTQKFRSNWQLSTERALSVLDYLLSKTKIDPRRFSAAGFAEHSPIMPNDTAENRSLNRRVDIVVIPRVKAK
ncbi:MAG TPA: OmpA family protein [Spirochaetota bacterium]|nr:OmpA family protein [Spirochaetota bacterium]HQO21707.1 OmpA family protein [Spirochaetota bacterium]HQQ24026.1 OmpA family protein [Spirochaetota bacterium]